MNATPAGPEQGERAELDELGELARLLPAGPVEQVLPPGRRSHHKDVLMQLIDRDRHDLQDGTEGARRLPGARPARRPGPLSRPARSALVAGAVAVALAAGLTLGVGADRHGGDPDTRAGASGTRPAVGRSAVVTLDRMAAVAMDTVVRPVREDQFVYVRSRVAENVGEWEKPVKLGPLHERQVWFSQEQGPVVDVGLIREDGQDWPIEVGVPDGTNPRDSAVPAGARRPTYAWLASLPTEPGRLLKRLYRETPVEKGDDRDQEVFDRIGDLIGEQVMPSATAAAFFKATARIPGVTEVDDAVDAVGRHGIAIAREDVRHGTRTEWIFDARTLDYLGERTVFSRDTARAKAGTVSDSAAVLERAVVDKRGLEPDERRRAGRS
ncbi:CU044_5270 family protein [Streptomyces sp. NBC_00704]|uniref:CU044_5270 family protein n=1 Tax=Streptomyces sp. NBC_00704 TaxID=2975809 RepID=UPI002E32D3BC|nr:CU044_5270 family protein [Streptomyces sp. NBC_00704]